MRLGIFGGTFDPIHFGHLRAAEEILESLGLNRILFIPAHIPPHKRERTVSPFHHRLKMVRLSVAGHPAFFASEVERQRPGVSYSIETIRSFARRYPGPGRIYFILGLDAFLEISTWKDYPDFFALCYFVVMSRPGEPIRKARAFLADQLPGKFSPSPPSPVFRHESGFTVSFQEITLLDISSTAIRNRVQEGRSIRYLVPEPVREYLLSKGLYGKKDT